MTVTIEFGLGFPCLEVEMVPTHHYLCPFSVDLFLLISWSRADKEDELEKARQDFLADIRGKNLFLVRPVLAIGIEMLISLAHV